MEKINGIKVTFEALKVISTGGVGYMVGAAAADLLPAEAKLPVKVCCKIGAIGVAGAINMKTSDYWDQLEEAVEGTYEAVKAIINAKDEEVKVTEGKPKVEKKETKQKSKKTSKKKSKPIEVEFEEIIEEEVMEA